MITVSIQHVHKGDYENARNLEQMNLILLGNGDYGREYEVHMSGKNVAVVLTDTPDPWQLVFDALRSVGYGPGGYFDVDD